MLIYDFWFRNHCTCYQPLVASPLAWDVRRYLEHELPKRPPCSAVKRQFSYRWDIDNQSRPVSESSEHEWHDHRVNLVVTAATKTCLRGKQDNCFCICPWSTDVYRRHLLRCTCSIHCSGERLPLRRHDKSRNDCNEKAFCSVQHKRWKWGLKQDEELIFKQATPTS